MASEFRRMKRKMERDIKTGISKQNELRLPTINEMEDYIKTKIEEFNKEPKPKQNEEPHPVYPLIED